MAMEYTSEIRHIFSQQKMDTLTFDQDNQCTTCDH